MLTINATLAAAMAAGEGTPIARMAVWKTDVTHEPQYYYEYSPIIKYRLGKDAATFYIHEDDFNWEYLPYIPGPPPPGLYNNYIILQRGVEINGVQYLVDSPHLYLTRTELKDQVYKIDFDMYNPDFSTNPIAANQTAQYIILYILGGQFLTTQVWHSWQLGPSGTTIQLESYDQIFGLLWSKLGVKPFPRRDGLFFKSRAAASGEDTATAKSWTTDQLTIIENYLLKDSRWDIHWEDGSGTHKLSDTLTLYGEVKPRNIGYLSGPTAAQLNMLLGREHGYLGAYEHIATIRPDFSIEQGDVILISALNDSIYANITEEFNMGGGKYPWQMTIRGERMLFP